MNYSKQKLLIEQIDVRLSKLRPLEGLTIPPKGWVSAIRSAFKMSLRQLGSRLNISPQSVKEIELREVEGTITIKSLRDAAEALEMKLVYGLIPKEESIERIIEKRALEIAKEIVLRTSTTMQLEGQENTDLRIQKAIKSKADELITRMPKHLWD